MPSRRLAILGSTGSVGTQTLEVCAEQGAQFDVVGLAAGSNAELLCQQAAQFSVPSLLLASPPAEIPTFPTESRLDFGLDALPSLIDRTEPDLVVNAIVGAAGLEISRYCLEQGIPLAIANKESIVIAGSLLVSLARKNDTALIPIDSEHCALHQCLRSGRQQDVRRLLLTASGGPFRGFSHEDLHAVTPEQALRHPNWEMGARITIDSATMMNKGLEIIEAHHLFSIPPERIEVVVHPQSIVHSMVEFHDGSWLAQLGPPDMRIAIRYALGYPERLAAPHSDFSLSQIAQLTFEEPDHHSFPSLELAYRACRRGGTLPAVLNAADEIAVDGFLAEKIAFNGIFEVVERALNEHEVGSADDWNQLLTADRQTRERVTSWIS